MSANDRNTFCCRTTPFHPEVADGVDSYLTTRFCKTTISPPSSNPTPWPPTNPPSAGFVCSTAGKKWDFLVCKGPNGLRQKLEQPMVIFFQHQITLIETNQIDRASRIAVNGINHLGDEVMRVFKLVCACQIETCFCQKFDAYF